MLRSFAVALLLGACSAATPPPASVPGKAPGGATPASDSVAGRPRDAQWGRLRIVSRAMELEVPELSAWRYHAGKTWVSLEHAPSDSSLELWLVRAERLARPADCEARARLERPELWRPLPETTVDRQSLEAPRGFRTELTVGITAEPGEPVMTGHLVAFGAAPGRCIAVHFTTHARGSGADDEIARRLDMIASRAVPSLALRGVEDRVGAPAAR